MDTYRYQPGETPVLVSIPHVGTFVPAAIAADMTDAGLGLPDTDWDIDRLFSFAPALGLGFLKATVTRHVIDLNRDPDDDTHPVCPRRTFDDEAVYKAGHEPDSDEVARRIRCYWKPYHDRLETALAEIRERHGIAVLLDLHSIRTDAAVFGDVQPPDISLGSNGGETAAAGLVNRLATALEVLCPGDVEVNGPFRGGHVIRRAGRPDSGIHAVFVELSQSLYMEVGPQRRYRDDLATALRPPLERMLGAAVEWARSHSPHKRT